MSHPELTLHPGDQDVYVLELAAPAQVLVEVTFAHASGDLDAKLLQGGLTGLTVASADSPDDDERLQVTVPAGRYYLLVQGYQGATNRYRLDVTVAAAPADGPPGVDAYEPNDTPALAPVVALPFVMQDGLRIASAQDVDYYAFDTDGAPRSLSVGFVHAAGDLDLFVEDGAGRVVAQSNGVTDVERVEATLPAGRYSVKVVGWSGATNAYRLELR